MLFSDILRTAFINLWRRKLRTFLTVLGMVIGVAAIVVMMSLGIGIQKSVLETFESAGSLTTIEVSSYKFGNTSSQENKLNDTALEKIASLNGVSAAIPLQEVFAFLKSGNYSSDITILGIDTSLAADFGLTLKEGRFPEKYSGGSNYEMVLGSMTLETFVNANTLASSVASDGTNKINLDSRFKLTFDGSQIYDDYESLGNTAPGRTYTISPVGIMSENNNEFAWHCIMDMEALEKLASQNNEFIAYDKNNYTKAYVKCRSVDDVKTVCNQISELGYGTYSLLDAVEMAQEQTNQVRYLLAAIGFVSLLIAAIGIMNTMMMSIYERTKEIGIMKVIGCSISNILHMFLTEAAYIGLFGGILGLGASYGLSAIINSFTAESGFVGIIPPYLAIGAVIFSIAVAVLSGIYPAMRAMRLSPLGAIRSE